ncbi:unnamed protein product, partial [Heterosigma akashiwo]
AITGADGAGTAQLLSKLQNLWLLGYSDEIITTPGSDFGIFGHARMDKTPIVVLNDGSEHQSTCSQPCLSSFVELIQQASCYNPSMLERVSFDPSVPC